MDAMQLLLWPALACLVLTGIHAYLGLHVVERGVIFVDLSLAQVAALGTTVAFLAGFDLHGRGAYFFSLGFTLIGAALFSLTRAQKRKIPQEAVIGIVYAVSAAAAIIIMDRLPEGAEHIKHLLVGNLLAVRPEDVAKMAVLYSLIGFLHWLWRKPFLTISTDPERAAREGFNVRLWDFLFYASFGFVVTSSVAVAGVLLVFSYLIVPSVTAMLFSGKVGPRLAIGWCMGTLASLIGMWGSYALDAPTGATVICTFGLALALLALARGFLNKINNEGSFFPAAGGANADLRPGRQLEWNRAITEKDVLEFAKLSGDEGSHHLQKDSRGRLMAHGLLTATLPTKLGGDLNFIADSMIFDFIRPVHSGDTLTCRGTVDSVVPKPRHLKVAFSFSITNQDGRAVLKGSSTGLIKKQ